MLRMRLQRRGKKNFATYRVVVADQRAPVKGRFVADLGPYNPHTKDFNVKKEVALEWLAKGVQPTPTVHNLLVDNKILKTEKMTSWKPKVRAAEEGEDRVKSAEANRGAGATAGDAEMKPEAKAVEGETAETKDEAENRDESTDEPKEEDKKEPDSK